MNRAQRFPRVARLLPGAPYMVYHVTDLRRTRTSFLLHLGPSWTIEAHSYPGIQKLLDSACHQRLDELKSAIWSRAAAVDDSDLAYLLTWIAYPMRNFCFRLTELKYKSTYNVDSDWHNQISDDGANRQSKTYLESDEKDGEKNQLVSSSIRENFSLNADSIQCWQF